jgi:hypothetical protein
MQSMNPAHMQSPKSPSRTVRALLVLLITATLAGCETTGSGSPGATAAAPEKPMTHAQAASDCWMQTEATMAKTDLDKRVVVVDKCIDEKMKKAKPAAAPAAAPAATPAAPAAPKT